MLNLFLIGLLIAQLCLSAGFELSHDEAYYWLYSKNLDWGFFDHPPIVGVVIKIFSFLPHSEFAIRAGFILMQIISCFLLAKLVPNNRRWIAVCLFFAFPLASSAGMFALPDMPLLFMAVVYCLVLKKFLEDDNVKRSLLLGITISILLYSKYHGILLVFFTLLAIPELFKKKSFYIVAVTSLLVFLPHLIWQYVHAFPTLKYHFFERPKADFSAIRLIEYLGTQVFLAGLFVGPFVWWAALKNDFSDKFNRAMIFISVGTVGFFFISTFSKKFEANWTIFLCPSLIYLACKSSLWESRIPKFLLLFSFVLAILSRFLLVADPQKIKIKRLTEFHGWREWSKVVEETCDGPILANTYQIASKLSFYLNKPVHAFNYGSRKNQFDFWMPNEDYYQTNKVCYVTDKKQFNGDPLLTPEGKKLKIVQAFDPSKLTADKP